MVKAGVAEMLIVRDDHITITDLPQRPQAQICDFSLGDSKAECTSVGAGERERERDGGSFNAKQTQKIDSFRSSCFLICDLS